MYELRTMVIFFEDRIQIISTYYQLIVERIYTNVPETQHLIYMDFTLSCAIRLRIIFSQFNFHGYIFSFKLFIKLPIFLKNSYGLRQHLLSILE